MQGRVSPPRAMTRGSTLATAATAPVLPEEPPEPPLNSLVNVFLRIRPLNSREQGEQRCIHAASSDVVYAGPPENPREHRFAFKEVVDSAASADSQERIFRALGQKAANSVLEGFSTCVFSLGQTGTGKTFTVLGTAEEPGLLPRIMEMLIKGAGQIKLSCLELYLDRLRDLLLEPGEGDRHGSVSAPEIRSNPSRGVYAANLREVTVDDLPTAKRLVAAAQRRRAVTRTSMNSASSRGHAVFQLELSSGAKLCVVDLAGRENERTTQCCGQALAELGYINKTLFHLTNVIQALASPRPDRVPYRNSKLTMLLSECLRSARTFMVATVSPALSGLDETLVTMKMAKAVRQITTQSRRASSQLSTPRAASAVASSAPRRPSSLPAGARPPPPPESGGDPPPASALPMPFGSAFGSPLGSPFGALPAPPARTATPPADPLPEFADYASSPDLLHRAPNCFSSPPGGSSSVTGSRLLGFASPPPASVSSASLGARWKAPAGACGSDRSVASTEVADSERSVPSSVISEGSWTSRTDLAPRLAWRSGRLSPGSVGFAAC